MTRSHPTTIDARKASLRGLPARVVKAAMEKSDYFTGGFDILKKWQKQKGTKKPVSESNGKGFDIMKQVVKNPTPVNK